MLITRLLPVLALLALGACNTVQGVGEDVGTAGRTIQSEAAQAEAGM
jgi:predicted small secreted protein